MDLKFWHKLVIGNTEGFVERIFDRIVSSWNIKIVSVKTVDEVLKHALIKELKPIKWAEIDQVSNKNKEKSEVTSAH